MTRQGWLFGLSYSLWLCLHAKWLSPFQSTKIVSGRCQHFPAEDRSQSPQLLQKFKNFKASFRSTECETVTSTVHFPTETETSSALDVQEII